jgi:hypothetical protein
MPLALDDEIYTWISNAATLDSKTRLQISGLLVETLSSKVEVYRSSAAPLPARHASVSGQQPWKTNSSAAGGGHHSSSTSSPFPRVSTAGGNLAQQPAVVAITKGDMLIGQVAALIAEIQRGEDDAAGQRHESLDGGTRGPADEDEIFTDRLPPASSNNNNNITDAVPGEKEPEECARESVVLESKEGSVSNNTAAAATAAEEQADNTV